MQAPDPLDALELGESQAGPVVQFGSVDVSYAASKVTTHEALNDRSTAEIDLRLGLLAGRPVDYLSIVTLGSKHQGQDLTRFTGNIIAAEVDGPLVRVAAETAPELTEKQVGYLEIKNAVVQEVVHLAVSTAGFPEDRINIEGLDEMLPLEGVEVVVPVLGVRVDAPVDLGPVRLVPHGEATNAVDEFNPGSARNHFQAADAYIVGLKVAKRLIDAEREILAWADDALAWLTVRARYGLALLPDGQPQEYRRVVARSRPRRGDYVLVRGIASGRRWFRAISGHDEEVELSFDPSDLTWSSPPAGYGLANRQALLACARAAQGDEPLERIQALWEAIEFHVAKLRPTVLFDKKEARRVRRSIPKDVDPGLRKRALELLEKINDPPVMAKLREAVRRDGVPLAQGEFELLGRLRDARNDAVHGRTPDLPPREDIDHAVSIVARMLVYRLQRQW